MKILLPLLLVLTAMLAYSLLRKSPNAPTEETLSVAPPPAVKAIRPALQQALAAITEFPQLPATSAPEPKAPEISHAELTRRAAKLEQETNHELNRLVELLDLTPNQQDRAFAILAQNSPDYHPTMGLASADNGPLASEVRDQPQTFNNNDEETPRISLGNQFLLNALANYQPPTSTNANTIAETTHAPSASDSTGRQGTSAASTPATEAPVVAVSAEPSLDAQAYKILGDLEPVLTPEQRKTLTAAEIDRQAWWDAVLADMNSKLPPPTNLQTTDNSNNTSY